MKIRHFVSFSFSLVGLALLLNGCAGAQGNGASAQSSGTPVNPFTNPGASDTTTAPSTGAQPRKY